MSSARYCRDGLYVCIKSVSNGHVGFYRRGIGRAIKWNDIHMVKAVGTNGRVDHVQDIMFPVDMIGKRIRLRVEVVEDNTNPVIEVVSRPVEDPYTTVVMGKNEYSNYLIWRKRNEFRS